MTTKLWIRTYKNRPAIFAGMEGQKVRVRVDGKEHLLSRTAWDRLSLWTGTSPFADEGKESFPPLEPADRHEGS
jgi:hypothetical protein